MEIGKIYFTRLWLRLAKASTILFILQGCYIADNNLVDISQIKVDENITVTFFYDADWDMSASVQARIQYGGSRGVVTAIIDRFVPEEEMPEYGFVVAKEQYVGVYRKNKPEQIILLLDRTNMKHIPFISKGYDQDKKYRHDLSKMRSVFFEEFPDKNSMFR